MNAFTARRGIGTDPIGVDVFALDRRHFFQSVREFVDDPLVSDEAKRAVLQATLSAMREMAILGGVLLDA